MSQKKWSMQEIKWMRENARRMTSADLMKHFNVTRPSLYYQTSKHKIEYIRLR